MTKNQEKLMLDLFERSFKIVKTLNYKQVAWILNQVSWLNHFDDEELRQNLQSRSDSNEQTR